MVFGPTGEHVCRPPRVGHDANEKDPGRAGMKQLFCRPAAMLLLVSVASTAGELQDYVQQCENELQFDASDVRAMNCNDGVRFTDPTKSPPPINDFFLYQSVNGDVDLAVACRWLIGPTIPAPSAFSVEMIIHNR